MSGLHVGIIMDGNGRWARQQGRPRWRGHLAGVDSVRDVVRGSPDLGITTLTLYAFSSDNWKRPPAEVGRLFWLLREYCRRETAELVENGVRVTHLGREDRIPPTALAELHHTIDATARGTRLHLRLAIDYGSRWAVSEAVRRLATKAARGALDPGAISADVVHRAIANGVPDPDLIVRTAGEQRLSDFRREDLALAVAEFSRRERRFGAVLPAPALTRARLVG
jgi:undecaprenyl diphosphate synthase